MGWYRSTEVSMDNQLKGYDDDDDGCCIIT